MKYENHTDKFSTINDALVHILTQEIAKNQNELLNFLSIEGFEINQSKISRLLKKLGTIKTRNSKGEVVYSLPKEPNLSEKTTNNIANLIVRIVTNENLIVIHTNPGSAPLVARLLDYKQNELGILGTIAGDDTVFVAPVSAKNITSNLTAIKELL